MSVLKDNEAGTTIVFFTILGEFEGNELSITVGKNDGESWRARKDSLHHEPKKDQDLRTYLN